MAVTFPKHPTFRNRSYLPLNVTGYTNDSTHGQRFALYEPLNKNGPKGLYIYFNLSGGVPGSSTSSASDATNTDLTTTSGHIWQVLNRGDFKVAVVQVSPPDAAASYTGRGFFNPPGEVGAYFETLTRHTAQKDAIFAIQHFRFYAATYGIDPDMIGVGGDSAGSHLAAWLSKGINYARTLGAGAEYEMPTHPNFALEFLLPVAHWNYYDAATAGFASAFPSAAGGNSVAANLADASIAGGATAGARYKQAFSVLGFTPMLHKRTVPTLLTCGVAPAGNDIYIPYNFGTTETDPHTGRHAFAVHAHFKNTTLALQSAAVGASFSTSHYDLVNDSNAAGVAGLLTSAAMDHFDHYKNYPNICFQQDREPWVWQSQVETGGRWICAPFPRSRLLRITNMDATNNLKLAHSPSLYGAVSIGPGVTAEITGGDGVFGQASASAVPYEIEEIVS